MKNWILASALAISSFLALPTLAADSSSTNNKMMDTVPSAMQTNMQDMLKMKASKMANRMMFMGIKMYAMGKMMMTLKMDQTMANNMMSNGTKLYNMGMQMNGGQPADMSKCMGMMKH